MVGKKISHYRILDKLGEGGMGVVYKAEDIRLKRLVALKFLLPDLTQDTIARSQFTLEAQTASALDHANICTIYEIDETKDGQTFISMAYYEGETLQNRLMRGPLPVEEAVDMAMQVAEGLVKAHNAEIIHRDINPANIVLTPEGKVKIIDFGLAILDGHMANITGTTLATIDYMSPEQIQAEIIDQRTDIWSLGVLLYEMLTGQTPFTGAYDQEVMYGIVQVNHTPLKDLRSDILPKIEQVVEKALQKEPDLRYQNINELLNDLEGLSTIRVHSKHAFGSRRNWLVGFIIILITALALVAGFSVFDNPESVATKILSENRIAILPFTVQGSDDIAYLGEGIVNLLSTNLDGAGKLHTVSPDAVFKFLKRDSSRTIDWEHGKALAEHFGAALYLIGNIFEVDSRLRVDASLFRISRDSLSQSRIAVENRGEEVFALVDQLSAKIVAEVSSGPTDRLTRLASRTTNSFLALKEYLKGERLRRQARYYEAVEAFERAVTIDTTFALAYYRYGQSALYISNPDRTSAQGFAKALKYANALSPRERRLLEAANLKTVESIKMFRELLAIYPDEVEAWSFLGIRLFWFAARQGRSLNEARETLERALFLDPDNAPPLGFSFMIAMYQENQVLADSLANRLSNLISGSDRNLQQRTLLVFSQGDKAAQNEVIADLKLTKDFELRATLHQMAKLANFTDHFDDALRIGRLMTESVRSNPTRQTAHKFLAHLYLSRGRLQEAEAELDSAQALVFDDTLIDGTLLLLTPPIELTNLRLDNLREALTELDTQPSWWNSVHRHYLSGLLSARLGQNDEALQAADALQAQSVMFSRDGAREKAAARARDYALSIRVQLATNDGKYKEALTLLDRRQPETWWSMVAFVLSTSQAYERYLRAESHFALGEYDEALRWYSSLGYGASREFVYSPVSHLKRAEIYEKLGQFETALKHYTRFVWFWKNCDLELKPLVDEIQLRIEQLKSGPLAKK